MSERFSCKKTIFQTAITSLNSKAKKKKKNGQQKQELQQSTLHLLPQP